MPDKDRKAFAKDLKTIYNAPSEEDGRKALDRVKSTWEEKYPRAMNRWYDNWGKIYGELQIMYEGRLPE